MYTIAEDAVFVFVAVLIGGTSLVSVATFLIVMEGFNAKMQSLRASRQP